MTSPALIAVSGGAYFAAMVLLVASSAPLGSRTFYLCAGVAAAAYAVILRIAWRAPADRGRWFGLAVAIAVAVRIPLAVPPVKSDNDMIRYLWDGRVQRLGLNPYAVRPADPGLEFTHTEQTRGMPSARQRTPYPPAAQLFFRFVVTLHDSGRAMKLALLACDLLTMVVLWRWLAATRRDPWLTLAYAWNPLVVLEVAHSGHVDVVGALWVLAAAFWLSRGRTALATAAFVLAVATKLLPVVLAPLLWRRISLRDSALGAALLVLLYLPYASGADVLFGIQNVVQHVRFNGPVFRYVMTLSSPHAAARTALILALATAAWCRWTLPADHPGAWAWPMAVAVACAPVVYPWYLLYLTPFLLLPSLLPLLVWCGTVLLTYVVWELANAGGPWIVPEPILWVEYGAVLAALVAVAVALRRKARVPPATRATG